MLVCWRWCVYESNPPILYISDEVVTAFGRLGEFFTSEKIYRLSPDIITAAKGLSSGYLPLGATIVADNISFDWISASRLRGNDGGWGGNDEGGSISGFG